MKSVLSSSHMTERVDQLLNEIYDITPAADEACLGDLKLLVDGIIKKTQLWTSVSVCWAHCLSHNLYTAAQYWTTHDGWYDGSGTYDLSVPDLRPDLEDTRW